jgi:hypothetical protein
MKLPRALLFSGFLFGLGLTAASAQTQADSHNRRVPAPVVAGPFQALGNEIRNPDADQPRRRAAPVTPPPTIIPPDTLENRALAYPGSR